MNLVWTWPAKMDRREIFEFIAADSWRAACRMDLVFAGKAELLTRLPEIGRPGRVPGTRELLAHRHYFLIYRMSADTVQILRLLHTSKQWPLNQLSRR
jgi:plasmid stabilization system protein ParE